MEPRIEGLRDPGQAAELARSGFLRTGIILDTSECARLADVFAEAMGRVGRDVGAEWFPTILFPEDEVRAFVSAEISTVVLPRIEPVVDLDVLEPVRIDFSVKPVGPDSGLGPHQDFSIVDERHWTSLYLWVPLVATDDTNGALHVVPGSHRFTNRVRAQFVPSVFDPVLDAVHRRSVRLDCAAGELVLMVSGLIHHSPPNGSDSLRLAAHGILKPREAPIVFFFADERTPEHLVEMYEVGIDDYVHLTLGGRPGPDLPLAGYCPRPPAEMTPDRFEAGCAPGAP